MDLITHKSVSSVLTGVDEENRFRYECLKEKFLELEQAAKKYFMASHYNCGIFDISDVKRSVTPQTRQGFENLYYLSCQAIHYYRRTRQWKYLSYICDDTIRCAKYLDKDVEIQTIMPYKLYALKMLRNTESYLDICERTIEVAVDDLDYATVKKTILDVYSFLNRLQNYTRLEGFLKWCLECCFQVEMVVDVTRLLADVYVNLKKYDESTHCLKELACIDSSQKRSWYWLAAYSHVMNDLRTYSDTICISPFEHSQISEELPLDQREINKFIYHVNNTKYLELFVFDFLCPVQRRLFIALSSSIRENLKRFH
jgi:tetratricopeptide (TPR) repeat protein